MEAFVRNLYELAQHCELGNSKDEQIWDQIVIGISDKDVSQLLQLEADLTQEGNPARVPERAGKTAERRACGNRIERGETQTARQHETELQQITTATGTKTL